MARRGLSAEARKRGYETYDICPGRRILATVEYCRTHLAKSRDPNCVDILIGMLEGGDGASSSHESTESRYIAAWALGEIRDTRATAALVQALDDESVLLRCHACYALAKIQDKQAVEALVACLQDGSTFCPEFTFSYVDTPFSSAIYANRKEGVMGHILPIPHLCVRKNALYALGQIGDPRAAEAAAKSLDERDSATRTLAILALGNMKCQTSADALLGALEHGGQDDRKMAIEVIGQVAQAEALEPLARIAEGDADEGIRKAAAEAIERIRETSRPLGQ